jgi:transcriptional regulator with XRE-family HTH domain
VTAADLRYARRALGLSQRALATRLGVTQATVARWETGHPIQHPEILRLALVQLAREHGQPARWRRSGAGSPAGLR